MTTKVVIVNCGPLPVRVHTIIRRPDADYLPENSEPVVVNVGEAFTGRYVYREQSLLIEEVLPT